MNQLIWLLLFESCFSIIGTENLDPIWRVCVGDTERVLGYPLGAMFVKSVFKGESKQTAETMIEQVRQAFEENLVNLEWMDSETKKRAKEKVINKENR